MRTLIAVALLALCSCARPSSSPAEPVRAEVTGRYALTVPGGTIGTITSAVRCGTTLHLSDVGRLHRLDLTDDRVLPSLIDDTVLPMALAADCARGRVWVVSPLPRGRGLRVIAFDLQSGKPLREVSIATACFPTSAVVAGDELFVGGECIQGEVDGNYVVPPAASYYSDKRIGARVSMTSGKSRPGLAPFETGCHGAGACVGGSVARIGNGWIASLPVSSRIGIYSSDGDLTRTVPVGSQSVVSDGTRLASGTGSDQRVQWSTRNSLIHRVFAVSDRLVVSHYVMQVAPGWTIASPDRPQFKVRMNVMTSDGEMKHPDVDLPELPVGADDESLYVVDYGDKGRQGAHESVTVLRIAIPK